MVVNRIFRGDSTDQHRILFSQVRRALEWAGPWNPALGRSSYSNPASLRLLRRLLARYIYFKNSPQLSILSYSD